MVSPEYNEFAKHAKDLGSAAVLIRLILAVVLWGLAAHSIFKNIL
jgi:diacylglycerol kinase